MFAQELARRGLAENGSVEGGPSAMERLKRAAGKAMPPAFAPDATPSATPRQDEIDNQLEKSRKLNAEGLEVRPVIKRLHRVGEPMHTQRLNSPHDQAPTRTFSCPDNPTNTGARLHQRHASGTPVYRLDCERECAYP